MTKRPLFVAAVFLVLGEFFAAWIEYMAFGWIAGISLPAVFFYYRRGKNIRQKAAGLILLFAGWTGCFLYLFADAPDAFMLYCEQKGELTKVWAEGNVEQIEKTEYGCQVRLKHTDVQVNGSVWSDQGIIISLPSDFGLRIGSRIGVQGTLKLFETTYNPGTFDLRQYYRSQGYGYRMTCSEAVVLDARYDYVREYLKRIREWMKENIYAAADEKDAGIFCAVFLGDKDAVDETIRELYERQGIAHLLSVSGLHISMLGMLIYRLIRRCSGSYGIAGIFGGIIVVLYGVMTGSSISAIRAVIMYLISLFAAWRGRIYDMQTSLAVAALYIACSNPLAVLQSSFQLSFSAVLGIGMITDVWKAFLLKEDRAGMIPAFAMQAMMLPALLFSFYEQPLFSILLNQLVVPLGGILIFCAAGCACFAPLGTILAKVGGAVLSYYEMLCTGFEQIPGGILVNGRPSSWRIVLYLMILAVLAAISSVYRERKKRTLSTESMPRNWKKRFLFVHLLASMLVCFAALFLRADPVQVLEIVMLDVGQGDCLLIRLPGGINFLSDCGSSSEKELAEYIVEPALLSMGIDSLDAVILSHADEDHTNGLISLAERGNIEIERVIFPDYGNCEEDFSQVIDVMSDKSVCVKWTEGTALEVGDAMLTCIHPFSESTYEEKNSASLVYRLTYGMFDMLFTGDIGSEEERKISTNDAEVLKAAHHGSKYSSSPEWIADVSPEVVMISCAKDNSYGHPHQETLDRFAAVGADCYITAKQGAVIVTSNGQTFEVWVLKHTQEE